MSSDFSPSCSALTGAPIFLRALLIDIQSPPCRYIIIIEPTPHCSPCIARPGWSMSNAWENMCSAPLVGLELPATAIDTPDMIIGFNAICTLSSSPGFMSFELSIIVLADISDNAYAVLLNGSFLILLAKSQSFNAVILDMTSAHPDTRYLYGDL